VLKVDSLPAQGIVLNQGWKFHPGDNLAWDDSDFDDSSWEAIDPNLDLYYLPQIRNSSVGWFRIKFRIDSSSLNKPLALQVNQHIASEIYLNGKLLKQYGRVSANAEQIKAYQPNYQSVGVLFNQPEQVIAVRFSVQENLPYINWVPYFRTLEIRINEIPDASTFEKFQERHFWLNYIETGVYIFLGLIFLGVFLVYDQQKANLYFSLSAFAFGIGNYLYVAIGVNSDVAFKAYTAIACCLLLWVLYNLFLFLAIYSLFSPRKGYLFWLVNCCLLVGAYLLFFTYQWTYILGLAIPTSLTAIELLRICLRAYRQGRRGVSIVIVGLITYLIFICLFILLLYELLPNPAFTPNYVLRDIVYRIFSISIPLALSIYLAREYAFTSKDLEQKLLEVQKLSAKTIVQEQEKQQILATENERLEQQVHERTQELTHQKEELQSTVEHLKATQTQLIQSEKMASLGELTAGIAHEIQNPLNFVNNFSEVSQELTDELQQELEAGDTKEAKAISRDIKQNLEKINFHGKRADSIVKSMLLHSRISSGEKQLTDINALIDEYLRLAYHGLRAKEKDFNADFKLEADPSVGKLSVVPQEIGRVMLNLFNNAFYATAQKKFQLNGQYQPQVIVTTKAIGESVKIHVRDNGTGIPEHIKSKIFQPFFTTKPTGEGTGLGLSLSYDIITKGHNGELKVDSQEGQYSEFIVSLPI
jgi:signal transduction histidine kinase